MYFLELRTFGYSNYSVPNYSAFPECTDTQKHLCTFDKTIPSAYNYLFSIPSIINVIFLHVSNQTLLYKSFAKSPIKRNHFITFTVQHVTTAIGRLFCHAEYTQLFAQLCLLESRVQVFVPPHGIGMRFEQNFLHNVCCTESEEFEKSSRVGCKVPDGKTYPKINQEADISPRKNESARSFNM